MAQTTINQYADMAPDARQGIDAIEYAGGKVGRKVNNGWQYDWRPEAYQDALSEEDVASAPGLEAFRTSEAAAGRKVDATDANVRWPSSASSWASGGQTAQSGGPDYSSIFNQQNQYLQQIQSEAAARNQAIAAKEAADSQKRDTLYNTLQQRATQATDVSANDPIIKGQVDAFRGEQ